uniref:Uncharacterized protein n=1 Tax=Rhabditophanes sp. KR3021 TaxID=114890 RepID=A0AC35U4V2_9BILA
MHSIPSPHLTSAELKEKLASDRQLKDTIALAVISRLHQWCCQLFWLTIICVMGACGDLQSNKMDAVNEMRRNFKKKISELEIDTKLVNNININYINSSKKSKNVSQIEIQLLRHLTCPQTAVLRPLKKSSKKRLLSRPPSPQLFDIMEEEME